MTVLTRVSRRRFLQLTGVAAGGLVLGAALPGRAALAGVLEQSSGAALNVFVSIREDGTVEIVAHRSEMGTGIRTSLPQIVADEMEADWQRVRVIQAQANPAYGSQNTDGSRSVRDFYPVMRQMGAAARTLLERAAADAWGVPAAQCAARNHSVVGPDGRTLGFGELAARAATLPMPEPSTLRMKPESDFRYVGHGLPIVDLQDMTVGKATYGIDVHLPEMLYASIERSPWLQGRIKALDADAARTVAGVSEIVELRAVEGPPGFNPIEGVAVLASNTWSALRGRGALQIDWTRSEHSEHDSAAYLDELVARVEGGPGEVRRRRGDVEAALASAQQVVTATYRTPYLAHAPMEPPVATARFSDNGCEVWACTQTPQATRQAVADALGLDVDAVVVHVTLLGGGFGRKSKPDFAVEAARLAAHAGRPVQVVWSREDDIRHDYFHACSAQHFRGALDVGGRVTAWLAREASPPIGATFDTTVSMNSEGGLSQTFASVPFAVPNLQIESHPAPAHVRIGWLRSVYNIPYAFGVGCFVDELAHAARRDPIEFWLALIGDDRLLDFSGEGFSYSNYGRSLEDYPYDTARLAAVIRALADRIPWKTPLPAGQGWGFSVANSFLSNMAVASKVEVRDGRLRVLEMHGALDAGRIVNPDRVHAQMEGGMIFGLSLALNGEITFGGGEAQQSNFHDYPVARMLQVPPLIRTYILPSEAPPSGVGEPPTPPVAPSIANAVFAACGQRIRELPLGRHFNV